MTDTITCCLRIDSLPGESPGRHPEEGRLYRLDLLRPAFCCFDRQTGRTSPIDRALIHYVGGLAPRASGEWVVDSAEGVLAVDPATGNPAGNAYRIAPGPRRERIDISNGPARG